MKSIQVDQHHRSLVDAMGGSVVQDEVRLVEMDLEHLVEVEDSVEVVEMAVDSWINQEEEVVMVRQGWVEGFLEVEGEDFV